MREEREGSPGDGRAAGSGKRQKPRTPPLGSARFRHRRAPGPGALLDARVRSVFRRRLQQGRSTQRLVSLLFCATLGCACDRSPRRAPGAERPEGTSLETPRRPTVGPARATPASEGALVRPAKDGPAGGGPATGTEGGSAPVDRGIFGDLDDRVRTECPPWTALGPHWLVRFTGSTQGWLAVDGVPVCAADEASAATTAVVPFPRAALAANDRDGDGLPDGVDLLRGAKKVALNGAAYGSAYRDLTYPGGDVPREEGVCTDVIVRALRNAGFDLQELLSEDIEAHPRRYPMVKKADPNIDHRRVRTLLPYFREHFAALRTDPKDTAQPYLPGDVLFLDTLGDAAPEHMGIVSDRLGESGLPLVVNNWTDGWRTQEMDLLGHVPVTHRFRVARRLTGASAEHVGLTGVLARRGLTVPDDARQLLLVTVPLWNSSGGQLRRYAREAPKGAWRQHGDPIDVRVGAAGLGKGLGRHESRACSGAPDKREGDKRAPAGTFALGTAFGRAPQRPFAPGGWPYRATRAADRFVDDPKSPHYNTWQVEAPNGPADWTSAERLTMYSLGLVVEHNTAQRVPGAGSAIFLHPWKSPVHPTVGCTAMDEGELTELLRWLEPKAAPVLVQVAGTVLQER